MSEFRTGLVSGADITGDVRACKELGAKLVRVDFPIATTKPSDVENVARMHAANGTEVLALATFTGTLPTVDQCRALASWPARIIEFGNETSFSYQYKHSDPWWNSSELRQRARDYALRFRDAHEALEGTGVGLLCQADDGGAGNTVWLDEMLGEVPDLESRAAGWTVHPYGPRDRWQPKLDRIVSDLGDDAPLWITEYGIATDSGRMLSDNYGWPKDFSYVEAANALTATVGDMRSAFPGIAAFLWFQARDRRPPGQSTDREQYFGALQSDYSPKGSLTDALRTLLAGDPETECDCEALQREIQVLNSELTDLEDELGARDSEIAELRTKLAEFRAAVATITAV